MKTSVYYGDNGVNKYIMFVTGNNVIVFFDTYNSIEILRENINEIVTPLNRKINKWVQTTAEKRVHTQQDRSSGKRSHWQQLATSEKHSLTKCS